MQGIEVRNRTEDNRDIARMYSSKNESIATFSKNVTHQLPDSVQHMAMVIAGNTIHADLLLELWRNIHPDPDDALAETYHSNLKPYQKKEIISNSSTNYRT